MDTKPEGGFPPAPRSGWWSRNWKWVVPVGCLGMVGTCGCLAAILLALGFDKLETSADAYTQAAAIAEADPEVQHALGTPIHHSFPQSTSVSRSNGRTHARFIVPLDGPKEDGTLHVEGDEEHGQWTFSTLAVVLESGGRIDLTGAPGGDEGGDEEDLTPPEPPPPPPPPGRHPPGEPGRDSDIEL